MSELHVPAPVAPMLPRTLYTAEHEAFRTTVRRFFETEIAPHSERFAAQRHMDRALWNRAGELGPAVSHPAGGIWRFRR